MAEKMSVIPLIAKLKVSSVLNRDVKNYGKQHLTDNDDETCWNSEQGSPQYILIEFERAVTLKQIVFQFQGGFVGKRCSLLKGNGDGNWEGLMDFYPNDNNEAQTFDVNTKAEADASSTKLIKIVFHDSTDFYGRITVYKMDLIGLCNTP